MVQFGLKKVTNTKFDLYLNYYFIIDNIYIHITNIKFKMSTDEQFSDEGEGTFIEWFCSHEEHSWFCEIDQEFLIDPLNLYGIRNRIPKFEYKRINQGN